jgi:hypothetical protein
VGAKALLEAGAQVNAKTKHGETPLRYTFPKNKTPKADKEKSLSGTNPPLHTMLGLLVGNTGWAHVPPSCVCIYLYGVGIQDPRDTPDHVRTKWRRRRRKRKVGSKLAMNEPL